MPNWIQYLPLIVAGAVSLIYLSLKLFKVKLHSERHTYPSCKHGTSKRKLCIHCRNEAEQFFNEPKLKAIPDPTALCECGHHQVYHCAEGCRECLDSTDGEATGTCCYEFTPDIHHVETPAEKAEADRREREEREREAAMQRTQDLINSNKLLRTCVTCGTMFYEGGRCVCYPH